MTGTDPCPGVASAAPTVSGGSGSVEADVLDMRATGRLLNRSGDDVRTLASGVLSVPSRLPMPHSLASPQTAATVGAKVLSLTVGPDSLTLLGLRLEVIARALNLSAFAYERVELGTVRALEAVQIRVGVLVTVTTLARTSVVSFTQSFTANPRGWVLPLGKDGKAARSDFGRRFVVEISASVYRNPDLVDMMLGAPRALAPLLPYETTTGMLLSGLRAGGLARDDKPLTITSVDPAPARSPMRGSGRATERARATAEQPPQNLAGLMDVQNDIASPSVTGDAGSRVRAQRVLGADGVHRWVVSIPGTQDWGVNDPHNPSDGPTNLALISGRNPKLLGAVTLAMDQAMRRAGVKPGTEKVMLTGHSQGGLVATRLAADPAFRRRFAVTSVVTGGSPASRVKVPDGVDVLALEHRNDLVPRLDQKDEPSAVNRLRVVLDPTQREGTIRPTDPSAGVGECRADNPGDVHHAGRYALTAGAQLDRDQVTDPRLRRWYADHDGFLRGDATQTYEYQIRRQ